MSINAMVPKSEKITFLQKPVMRRIGALCFLAPALFVPLSVYIGKLTGHHNFFAYFPLFIIFFMIPILDHLIGTDTYNPNDDEVAKMKNSPYWRGLPLLAVPIQFALLIWTAHLIAFKPEFNLFGQIGLCLSVGVISTALAINVAHELVHRQTKIEQWAGGLLLASVCYGTFKIEHIRGHHVDVATSEDASSAKRGQNIYSFVPRAIVNNITKAWSLENKRLSRLQLPDLHWRNEILWWSGLSVFFAIFAFTLFGWAGLCFFLIQAITAIAFLELINFVEHYGLKRKKLDNGRYEKTQLHHSWNSSYLLTNLLLLNLQRHSDHHVVPYRNFPTLRHFEKSPQLPAGYGSMILLAMIPPLWRAKIHPILDQWTAI